jgi:hypothetical protein
MQIRRRNFAWLGVTGTLVLIAALSGIATPAQTAALVGLYGAAVIASMLDLDPAALLNVRRSSMLRLRMSSQAKEAVERAVSRGSTPLADAALLDVGMIVSQFTPDGMTMRRTRALSKDDDGVRPYVTLNVAAPMADRNVVIRFEMLDHHGQPQYIHEMRTYLRDGEMNILADHQLPLADNESLVGVGDGDLRVYIDGSLAGALSFTLAPSMRERRQHIDRERSAQASNNVRLHDDTSDSPLSLEDLLRSQSQNQGRN